MRIPFYCSLLLAFALAAFAEERTISAPLATPSQLAASQQTTAPANKPDWLPVPEAGQVGSKPVVPVPLESTIKATIEPSTPVAKAALSDTPSTVSAPVKKTVRIKSTKRKKKVSSIKAVGRLNNVPPLLAAAVVASRQHSFPWSDIFPWEQPTCQVAATPPLLAGIRPVSASPAAGELEPLIKFESILTKKLTPEENGKKRASDNLTMLASLVELQKNIKLQISITTTKLQESTSEAEKVSLQEELTKLDKQLSESVTDFERIATGVEPKTFGEQKPTSFSWKDELATLLEPSIKELKQLTERARQKSELRDTIDNYSDQVTTAHRAVNNLNQLIADAKDPKIKTYLGELLPAWQNMENRIRSKLDLAQMELSKLEDKDVSLLESSSNSMKNFFRDRGWYLLIAFVAFIVILLVCKLLFRLILYVLPGSKKDQRPFHVRILELFFKISSIFLAICGLVFVLYTAEDWFLLSMTIILFLGLAWTVRQTLPRLVHQVRLMLNMGSIREGERVIYNGIPWRVESLNVFCKLHNPALGMSLRIPIENMIGLISRAYHPDEPWFPCKRGDWVMIGGNSFAKVTSLSPEQVEVVEIGGRRVLYQTSDFLAQSPANLSRDFNVGVSFGLSYNLQAEITTTIPKTLETYISQKLNESGYGKDCLNLSVDFLQAGASSLDLIVYATFKGEQAPAYGRVQRAIGKWCVECCNANNWEIPFPQMTVHLPSADKS
jgi:small-conductance mechanosensitive channel